MKWENGIRVCRTDAPRQTFRDRNIGLGGGQLWTKRGRGGSTAWVSTDSTWLALQYASNETKILNVAQFFPGIVVAVQTDHTREYEESGV